MVFTIIVLYLVCFGDKVIKREYFEIGYKKVQPIERIFIRYTQVPKFSRTLPSTISTLSSHTILINIINNVCKSNVEFMVFTIIVLHLVCFGDKVIKREYFEIGYKKVPIERIFIRYTQVPKFSRTLPSTISTLSSHTILINIINNVCKSNVEFMVFTIIVLHLVCFGDKVIKREYFEIGYKKVQPIERIFIKYTQVPKFSRTL